MLKSGEKLSLDELELAFSEFKVICEDMSNSAKINISIHNHVFAQKEEGQKQIAIIVTRLRLNLTENKKDAPNHPCAHEAVRVFSDGMKGRVSDSDGDIEENSFKVNNDVLKKGHRLMTQNGCLPEQSRDDDGELRQDYLNANGEIEGKRSSFSLTAGDILDDVLPLVKTDTYKQEKAYVHLKPLDENGDEVKAVDAEKNSRTQKREVITKPSVRSQTQTQTQIESEPKMEPKKEKPIKSVAARYTLFAPAADSTKSAVLSEFTASAAPERR